MKLLTASEIKKILLGVVLSDGHIDVRNQRFAFYSKHEEYVKYLHEVITQISGMESKYSIKQDRRGYVGFRLSTKKHAYWKNLSDITYNGRKYLSEYSVSRLNAESLAHMWMCDGYLEHSKNRKLNKVQNIGWLCCEAFPIEEVTLLQKKLFTYKISSSLVAKPWGYGWRLRMGGDNLQRFISLIFPYVLNSFAYKTFLFYKDEKSADTTLPSAEQFIIKYNDIEDIVRYSQK